MWIYLIFLLFGATLGFFLQNRQIGSFSKYFMNFSIIVLLFFMGIGIGKDQDLHSKIVNFGVISFTITIMSVLMSIVMVYIIIKIFGEKD
ncbi:MAG: LysO family transporter [Calditerrivibrio sp.]|nr:LysO family transporter [Calditerrivibrio sp.]MCA1933043.1 LysO family transporter [Calditerrivibrio sp.]MCA1980654.1 LysO family transporter [Calditerrivibrio sp.]